MGDFRRQPTRMFAHRGAVGPVLPGSQCLAKLGSLSFRRFVRRFHHILNVLQGVVGPASERRHSNILSLCHRQRRSRHFGRCIRLLAG